MLLILSQDADFAQVVADGAKEQLKLASRIVETVDDAKAHIDAASFVVTTEPLQGRWPVPVLAVSKHGAAGAKKAPVRLKDILNDIRQSLRAVEDDTLAIGPYRFSARAKSVTNIASGKSADLTDKEVQLLQSIAKSGKQGIAKELLLKQVWGVESGTDTHTLETHIYRLRAKFRELGDEGFIVAEGGRYALSAA